jgi:hypothetical protein
VDRFLLIPLHQQLTHVGIVHELRLAGSCRLWTWQAASGECGNGVLISCYVSECKGVSGVEALLL